MKNYQGGIQYLPIRILRFNDECINGFYIANFLNLIDAFDEEKSIFTRFDNDFPMKRSEDKQQV